MIVHQCRNYEAMTDFNNLPQLLVVNGEIQGLKMFIGDIDMSAYTNSTSRSTSIAGGLSKRSSSKEKEFNANGEKRG